MLQSRSQCARPFLAAPSFRQQTDALECETVFVCLIYQNKKRSIGLRVPFLGDSSRDTLLSVRMLVQSLKPPVRTNFSFTLNLVPPEREQRQRRIEHPNKIDALTSFVCFLQRNRGKRPATEGELIHDEIEQQVSRCQCRRQFKCAKVGDGKYKVSECAVAH